MLLDKNDSFGESKKQGGIFRKNSKRKGHEVPEKNLKISIDAFHNELEESTEIKFQKKIIRCSFFKIKNKNNI